MTAREDALAGARAIAPILLGVVPFALVAGVSAVQVGMSPVQAVGMSLVLFAGASQLAAIDLVGRNAPATVVVLTAVVINLRFVMYSASIAPYFRRFGRAAKLVGAYLLTDQAYAVSVTEFRETAPDDRSRKWYYFGAAATLWATWQAGTVVGALAGAGLPDGLSLEFAVPLTFLALLFPAIEDRQTAAAAAVAAVVGVVAAVLPFDLGLVTAALVGVAAGVALDVRGGAFPVTEDGPATGDGEADRDTVGDGPTGGNPSADDRGDAP